MAELEQSSGPPGPNGLRQEVLDSALRDGSLERGAGSLPVDRREINVGSLEDNSDSCEGDYAKNSEDVSSHSPRYTTAGHTNRSLDASAVLGDTIDVIEAKSSRLSRGSNNSRKSRNSHQSSKLQATQVTVRDLTPLQSDVSLENLAKKCRKLMHFSKGERCYLTWSVPVSIMALMLVSV
eukprot:5069798-Pyramimonas_sp.AAC.1